MELHQLIVRVDKNVVEGMKVIKDRTRNSLRKQTEDALRDWVAKHGVQIEQPKTDV